jgi:hypothetical protein
MTSYAISYFEPIGILNENLPITSSSHGVRVEQPRNQSPLQSPPLSPTVHSLILLCTMLSLWKPPKSSWRYTIHPARPILLPLNTLLLRAPPRSSPPEALLPFPLRLLKRRSPWKPYHLDLRILELALGFSLRSILPPRTTIPPTLVFPPRLRHPP